MSETTTDKETIPFYPDHLRTEVRVMAGFFGLALVIGVVGLISPIGLGSPADPMDTPAHIKPEWYFLALYQILKYIPKTLGAVIPVALVGLITLWPFIDRKWVLSPRNQRTRLIFAVIGLIGIAVLTIWGEVS